MNTTQGWLRWTTPIRLVGLALSLLLARAASGGILYGVDDNSSQQSGATSKLYRIDETTGAAVVVGNLGQRVYAGGLAYDSSSGKLYVSDIEIVTPPFFSDNFGSIDLATGAVTVIGQHTGAGSNAVTALAYDSAHDVLYGSGNAVCCANHLVVVDRATGGLTLVGSLGQRVDGMAYDRISDTLFGINASNLYRIDRASGAATLVGAHHIPTAALDLGLDADWDSGVLFASDTTTDSLYRLDAATGASTFIGSLDADIGALASLPQPEPPPPASGEITSSQFPNFRFWVRISDTRVGAPVADCLPETVCVAGAIPTRAEVLLRIVGPKPNGYLWPNIVKFNTTKTEVWIRQVSTGATKYYLLPALPQDSETLPGRVDKTGFLP